MKRWKTQDFDYYLPTELIAQEPAQRRDISRLLIVDRKKERLTDIVFSQIVDYFSSEDVLVLNNSKVIPVRLLFTSPFGKEREVFLLERREVVSSGEELWEALVRPGKKLKKGASLETDDHKLKVVIEDFLPFKGGRLVRVQYAPEFENIFEVLDRYGQIPLPPYVENYRGDLERYQTVYAQIPGSSAAPTAGLHFTPDILKRLKEKGVEVLFVTLHVGLGTFRPVETEYVEEHKMHSEHFVVKKEVLNRLKKVREAGKRIVACGTTTIRVLESIAEPLVNKKGDFSSDYIGETDIFIYPGYQFKIVDRLITNFHLPKSTLLMLVSAFAGKELIEKAYQYAVRKRFRFFSFGDAMLII